MREMSAIEYSKIVEELSDLVGKHLSNVYLTKSGNYRFKIASNDVIVEPGKRLHRTGFIEESAEMNAVVQKLRKEVRNKRLVDIKQINNDRIIKFDFGGPAVVFEMFGKGNIILVKEGVIDFALEYRRWSTREIKRGVVYSPPPKPKSIEEIKKEISESNSDRYVIAVIATGLGKLYSKEILYRTGIEEKREIGSLSDSERAKIVEELDNVIKAGEFFVYVVGENALNYSMGRLTFLENELKEAGKEVKILKYETLNEAADYFYNHLPEEVDEGVLKLTAVIEQQKKMLEGLKNKKKELGEKGEFIVSHQLLFSQLLGELNSLGLGRLEEMVKSKKELVIETSEGKFRVRIVGLDKKEKSVDVEIEKV